MKKLFVALVIFLATSVNAQWVQMNVPTAANICCFTKIGTNLFAETRRYSYNQIGGVYFSTNNGYNWSSLGFANKDIYSIAASDSNLFVSFESTVCLSTNNGTNWNYVGFIAMVSELAVLGSKLFAGCISLNSGIYCSTNNGKNWNLSGLNDSLITKLEVSGTNIYAGTHSGIYTSTDYGINWLAFNQGFNFIPNAGSLFIKDEYLFVGDGQSVWRRPLSEITDMQNISTEIPSSYLLSQNYPNPFNPKTAIRFQVTGNSIVAMKDYDVIGREVQTLVNERLQAGTYETIFDGSNYSSGVYFYKLITKNTLKQNE